MIKTEVSADDIAGNLVKQRGKVYGKPSVQLSCAAELKAVYRLWRNTEPSAHDEAIENILSKISRIACGEYHEDNYDDIMGYAKIAKDLGK